MIKIEKELGNNEYLIHLEGTEYYQVWNKWNLFELLLETAPNIKEGWDEELLVELKK